MLLKKRVMAGRYEILAFDDDAFCYIEVFDVYGKMVENLSMVDCEGAEFNELVKKYEEK